MKRLLPSFILLLLLISSVLITKNYFLKETLPKLYALPDFQFISHHDMKFSKANLLGKTTVVDFIFTKCPGICPAMTRKMAELYNEFDDEQNIQFVSFSVDPTQDSLKALQYYAEKWQVSDQRWHFIQTEEAPIALLYESGFKFGGVEGLPYSHSGAFVLVDSEGFILGYYNYDDDVEFALLKEHLEQVSGS